jgi:hypothetical protein
VGISCDDLVAMVSKRTTRASPTLCRAIRTAFDNRSIRRGMIVAASECIACQTWIRMQCAVSWDDAQEA